MTISKRIQTLSEIGRIFNNICNDETSGTFPGYETIFNHNTWFTKNNIRYALKEWSKQLTEDNIQKWLSTYSIPTNFTSETKLGIIMAGNVPFVGLHDLICGYILGTKLRIKLSSKDTILMKWFVDLLSTLDDEFKNNYIIYEDQLDDFNAIIATGSNNSNRYFEYYFKSYPKILRRNRSSIAVLTGNESKEDLDSLADDVFTYFGLGCRNVTSLRVPEKYDFNFLAEAFGEYHGVMDNNKYANNFNYQYTIIAMNRTMHINMHNVLLIENLSLHSPVGIINYSHYSNIKELNRELATNRNEIQCIVSNQNNIESSIAFGQTQKPSLSDYADNIDTLDFLLNLHNDY